MNSAVRALLEDIRDYANEAVALVGEAAAQLLKIEPQGLGGLELREAASVRNILVHGYGNVRMDRIILVVRGDLPRLVKAVDSILREQEQ